MTCNAILRGGPNDGIPLDITPYVEAVGHFHMSQPDGSRASYLLTADVEDHPRHGPVRVYRVAIGHPGQPAVPNAE
jgi:hypothetical protein